MVNKIKTTKLVETLANKEKSSQIASRILFPNSLFYDEFNLFIHSCLLLKDEMCVKINAGLEGYNLVNRPLLMVNRPDYYVKTIDKLNTNN